VLLQGHVALQQHFEKEKRGNVTENLHRQGGMGMEKNTAVCRPAGSKNFFAEENNNDHHHIK